MVFLLPYCYLNVCILYLVTHFFWLPKIISNCDITLGFRNNICIRLFTFFLLWHAQKLHKSMTLTYSSIYLKKKIANTSLYFLTLLLLPSSALHRSTPVFSLFSLYPVPTFPILYHVLSLHTMLWHYQQIHVQHANIPISGVSLTLLSTSLTTTSFLVSQRR